MKEDDLVLKILALPKVTVSASPFLLFVLGMAGPELSVGAPAEVVSLLGDAIKDFQDELRAKLPAEVWQLEEEASR